MGYNVLSLFDGMAVGYNSLINANIEIDNYYASEIDKYAIAVAKYNHHDIIQIGNVQEVKSSKLPKIDLLIGGSPCQGFSLTGKQLAFDDPRSKLFFEYVRLLKTCKPKYFLLENVRMKKEHLDVITSMVGVEPICINSNLLSAQNRVRYYWTNIPNIVEPEDKKIFLKDILDNVDSCVGKIRDKSKCVRAGGRGSVDRHEWDSVDSSHARKFTVMECERLQTLSDDYTKYGIIDSEQKLISNSQRYKMIGNGWTQDVITYILNSI